MSETIIHYHDVRTRHGEHAAFLEVLADAAELVRSAWPFQHPEGYRGLDLLAEAMSKRQVEIPDTPRFSVVLEALSEYRNNPIYAGVIIERTIEEVELAKGILQQRVETIA